MIDDLVKRLLSLADCDARSGEPLGKCMREAASRIEALTAERERLRVALKDIIADCEADYPPSHGAIKYAAKLALKEETP